MLEIMGRTKLIYVKEEIKWVFKATLNIKHYIKIKPFCKGYRHTTVFNYFILLTTSFLCFRSV